MEAAKIEWKSIESIFVVDQVFENINAPQWVDFLASPSSPADDVAWFCRPDCKHPATAEDFLKSSLTSSTLLRSVSVSKLIGLADWTLREATNLKRRGAANQLSGVANEEDSENQNPNFSTPPNHNQIKHSNKAGIKSSAPKDNYSEIILHSDDKPRLKPTLSAKDLFGGRDLFSKITDFCNDLKKMARTTSSTRVKETEDVKLQEEQHQELGALKFNSNHPYKPLGPTTTVVAPALKDKEGKTHDALASRLEKKMNDRDKERKPLLEVKFEAGEKTNCKSKLRKKIMRDDEAENIPISLDLNNIRREPKISPIRLNPPTPQGFSATSDPIKASKGPKSRLVEREIFQELGQNKTLREELDEKNDNGNASVVAAKEGRTLDVFWFLKPCTLSS